ncbi:metal ABC transporter solute-binding protein, Zn/Mn family [Naasia sp. SYSU D00948]|uniref:metal ABC transporter solute-binding protein, Zn/Mn family n=1 Tax=Naasia sp. SYSU D00948 TaxID=2817379 RepID=UPI001B314CB2|nr:zinc ABC transporter substrate-binding protein [Naasia sp. SYSU D00948]
MKLLPARAVPALTVSALVAALTGCAAPAATSDEGISLVASTDVWASVAQAVAGDRVEVTAIIDSPDKDPHEYEATARDQLAVSRADLVVENGGGYDPFLHTLLDASGAEPVVISAVELSGLAPEEEHEGEEHDEGEAHADEHEHIEGFNEHVWYDLGTAGAVAEAVAEELSRLDPAGKGAYAENLAGFRAALAAIEAQLGDLHTQAEGMSALVTEPVPLWLLSAAGFTDATPAEFSEAVEEGSDVAPAVLQDVLTALASGGIALLAYNEQAETSQTERVRETAEAAGIPVVAFTETLPEGEDYVTWMEGNVERVAAAVSG